VGVVMWTTTRGAAVVAPMHCMWREGGQGRPRGKAVYHTDRARLLRSDRQIRDVGWSVHFLQFFTLNQNYSTPLLPSSRGTNVPELRGLRAGAGVEHEILQRPRRCLPRPGRALAQQRDQRPQRPRAGERRVVVLIISKFGKFGNLVIWQLGS
jgi:hypothetical protein